MNYQKIYSAFIADRRTKEADLKASGAYSEKHHVQPRSLGGGNSASNIIRLSAREHYFAHCCLAKIHGGKMWVALRAMANFKSQERGAALFVKGRFLEVAKRKHAEYARAQTKSRWDKGDFDGRQAFQKHTEESKAIMADLARGRTVSEVTKVKMLATQQRKAPRYTFKHESGEIFTGTGLEFRQHSGLPQGYVSKLVTEGLLWSRGWCLAKNSELRKGAYDRTVRIFCHKDGRRFEGTQYDFKKEHGVAAGGISNLVSGKRKSVGGWSNAS